MTLNKPAAFFATFLGLVVSFALAATAVQEDKKAGLRYVEIEVRLDDQVLWEGNASDDGHANADEVWNRLKEAPLRRGPDFDANVSKIRQEGDTASLEGDITVDVRYGGQVTLRELTLKKVVTDKGERWLVPAELVEKRFWSRLVPRLNASNLKDFRELGSRP